MSDPYRTPGDPGPTREQRLEGLRTLYWALMATNTVGKSQAQIEELNLRIADVVRRIRALQ